MLDVIFWMLFLFTPLAMVFLLRVSGEQINQISLVNIVTVSFFAFSVIGTLPLFYQLDEYRVATGVTDKSLVLKVLFFSCLNILVFLMGVIFVRKLLLLKPVPIVSSEIKILNKIRFVLLVCVLFIVMAVLYIYLGKIDQVALVVALKEGAAAAGLARSKMGNDFSGKYHWYSLVLHNIGTIVTLSFYVAWLLKKRFLTLVLFLVAFSISAFVAIMATEKEPFIGLLMALFMAHYLTRHNGYVPKKDIVVFGGVVISILVVFYIYFMGSGSASKALWSVFSRAFAGSISPAYFYLEYFPEHQDFMLGKSFPNPGGIMPYTPINFTIDLMNWKFPDHVKTGVVGTMPTVFWGEAYANFGVVGIPIIAFVMGVLVATLSYFVSKLELNPLTIAFTVWLIFHLKTLSVTGFSGFLYDFYMIFVTVVVIAVLFSSTKVGIRKKQLSALSKRQLQV